VLYKFGIILAKRSDGDVCIHRRASNRTGGTERGSNRTGGTERGSNRTGGTERGSNRTGGTERDSNRTGGTERGSTLRHGKQLTGSAGFLWLAKLLLCKP
jgi:hypothetical protein